MWRTFSCRDSRVRGIICAHSLAVGLQILKPPASEAFLATRRSSGQAAPAAQTGEAPRVELTWRSSLRHLEAEIRFRYMRPGVANSAKETEALTRLLECGVRPRQSGAPGRGVGGQVFRGAVSETQGRLGRAGGERFQHVTRDLVRIEPQFAIRERGDGWLDFHAHYSAGKGAVFSTADLRRLLQTGSGHVRLKDGRIAVAMRRSSPISRRVSTTAIRSRSGEAIAFRRLPHETIWRRASRNGRPIRQERRDLPRRESPSRIP